MKKLPMRALLLTLALALATPAFAGHGGYYRGQRVFAPHRLGVRPFFRPHLSFSFGFGIPGSFYGSAYRPAPVYYRPAPVMVDPYYGPPPVWIPGHYAWEGGYRVYVEGCWGRHGGYDRYGEYR